jgi:hypothetical protein
MASARLYPGRVCVVAERGQVCYDRPCVISTPTQGAALQGTAGAQTDLSEQNEGAVAASQWLIKHLLQSEHRPGHALGHAQMFAVKFALHRDLAGFDFASSKAD